MFRKILSFITVDTRLRTNFKHYILQSLLIFICVGLVLLLCEFFDSIIAASLGASSFILFVSPHTNSSRARYVVGGYISGALSGIVFNLIYSRMSGTGGGWVYAFIALRAAAVAAAAFIMIVLNLEHPPAAALALGLTDEPECIEAAAAAVAGVVILCLLRRILKKQMIDLI